MEENIKKRIAILILMAGAFELPCAAAVKDMPAALTALNSAEDGARLDAIIYLAAQRSPGTAETLAKHFQTEKDPYLRMQLVRALDVSVSTWAASCALAAAVSRKPVKAKAKSAKKK